MVRLDLNINQYLELEKIGLGAFHPIKGFVDKADFQSIVENMRLVDGSVFSLPIILDVNDDDMNRLKKTYSVSLYFHNELVGKLYPREFYSVDRCHAAKKIYGTSDITHPGVSYFYKLNNWFVGGDVDFLKRINVFSYNEMTPDQTKAHFKNSSWKKIVGFQTRNVPHRAHEYLLRIALEISDGIFVQPLIGKKKIGDFTPTAILAGYQALIENYLPEGKVLLGTLSTNMRYAGPREAIFHAVVRRNYGCTHFIVGRDHAGVGNWYGLYDAHHLISEVEHDLGIDILRLKGPYYCKKCDGIATDSTCKHSDNFKDHISGTYMRKILSSGGVPNLKFMREEVVNSLAGLDCFIKED